MNFPKAENVKLDINVLYTLVDNLKLAEKRVLTLQATHAPVAELAVALAEVGGLLNFICDETKAIAAESKAIYNLTYAEQKSGGKRDADLMDFLTPKSKKAFD